MSKKTSLRKLKSQTRPKKSFELYSDRLLSNLREISKAQQEQNEENKSLFSKKVTKNTKALNKQN